MSTEAKELREAKKMRLRLMSELLSVHTREGELYEKLPDGKVRCYACGHRCLILEGHDGICRVRFNRGGTLFVPWLNLCAVGSSTSESIPAANFGTATGGLTAIDAATGKVKWNRRLPHADFGAATVANDVVFTSDFTGKIYAYSTDIGKLLWTTQAPAGVNGFPAVTDHMLLVGAGTPGLGTIKKPVYSLTAYSLG